MLRDLGVEKVSNRGNENKGSRQGEARGVKQSSIILKLLPIV